MEIHEKKLHWTQRMALVRHSLHVGSRTRNFSFFKFLQVTLYAVGVDHIASLSELLGDDADAVIASLDKTNAVIACVYEDAFKAVYDSVKQTARDTSSTSADRRAIFFVDVSRQKQLASAAADKMINMAVDVIQSQPEDAQDEAAEVFITGMTFVADAIEVSLSEMDKMEHLLDDFIRLEDSWSQVQSSTGWTVSAMKGVFNLMGDHKPSDRDRDRDIEPAYKTARTPSIDSYARNMLRRMSSALSHSSTSSNTSATSLYPTPISPRKVSTASLPGPYSRRSSAVSIGSIISPKRASFAFGEREREQGYGSGSGSGSHSHCMNSGTTNTLSPIPPTPADALVNPFDVAVVNEMAYNSNSTAHTPTSYGPHRQRSRTSSIISNIAPNERPLPQPYPQSHFQSNSNSNSNTRDHTPFHSHNHTPAATPAGSPKTERDRPLPLLLHHSSSGSPKSERPPLVSSRASGGSSKASGAGNSNGSTTGTATPSPTTTTRAIDDSDIVTLKSALQEVQTPTITEFSNAKPRPGLEPLEMLPLRPGMAGARSERPPLVHAPPSVASASITSLSSRSVDTVDTVGSAVVYADDPMMAKSYGRGSVGQSGILGRISSVLYAAPRE